MQNKHNIRTLSGNIKIVRNSFSEWVSDCCLTPIQQFFQLYHGENKLICNEMMMKSNTLSCLFFFYSETTVRGQTCRSTRTYYSDSELTSLCSFSLMLLSGEATNTTTGAWTHDLGYRTRGGHANHYATDAVEVG